MSEQMSPHQRVEKILLPFVATMPLPTASKLRRLFTTALQSQSNADEARHREQQAALRTLLAEALLQKDAVERTLGAKLDEALAAKDAAVSAVSRLEYEVAEQKRTLASALRVHHAALAHAAEMRRALEAVVFDIEREIRIGYGIFSDEQISLVRTALSSTPGEALERVRREVRIAALEALPCEGKGRFNEDCLEFENLPLDLWCSRCKVLAELKGGRG